MREFHEAFAGAISAPVDGPLAIYRNTALAGAADALSANFPVVRALVGEEMFTALAVDHASQRPPLDPVLATYGADFPEWIEEQSWAAELPYVSDLARVERLHGEALFAADAAPLDPGAFARLAAHEWTRARLTLHPATRLACSRWPAASLWRAHQPGGDLDTIAWRPEYVLVSRAGQTVAVEAIPAPAHRFVLSLARGASVAAAVEATLAAFPDADIAAAFALLLNRGAFVALTV
ncbi:DNA-binding domain-containing protein [Novosphingobium sp. Gsoil 351]|uniref:HvfC/BufC N-terminal domain-containing protein n=1 Tax=Novosphingobium sp. Gsoil 351 TaxID=2675225 RepID=UPI0012B47814|nr:DNA-binding domain-containing protein [Novosphingobium sp. Gsoil 351]QGN55369.1 DUF2063 domain-containing protein [Novosphingobium sp. Gsoil 351]